MKLIFSFSMILIFLVSNLQSQVIGGSLEKLAKLYNSEKYETCLYKAENLTYKDDFRKNPEPYLYMAMCFIELSNSTDPAIKEDFKNGLKQAIKHTAKFAKYDKEGEMYEDNFEFIQLLKDKQFSIVKDYFNTDNYRKAGSSSKAYGKLIREKDYSIVYFRGITELLSNNYSQGTRNLDEAKTELNIRIKDGNLKIDNTFKSLVSASCIRYSEYLVNENKKNDALENFLLGKKMIPNNKNIETKFNELSKELKPKQDSIQTE